MAKLPAIGKPAPRFFAPAVNNGKLTKIRLANYRGRYLVLFFYPFDFDYACTSKIIAFSNAYSEFNKIGCEVLAASTDSQYTHLAWVNTTRLKGGLGDIKIPLLADKSAKVAKAYGVYNEETGIPYRGLFIIDAKQNLRKITTIHEFPVGRSVEEILRLVKGFQFTDYKGEVCPAMPPRMPAMPPRMPGSNAIKPDPVSGKRYYFRKSN